VRLAIAVAPALTGRRAAERARCKARGCESCAIARCRVVSWLPAESCYGFLGSSGRDISFSFGEATCKQAQSL
jgi:hypothetical protein